MPRYVESLDSKDSIPCPHLLCSVVLYTESDLWNHLGDIHSTHKPQAQKKRPRQQREGDDERAEVLGAAQRKRRRLLGKLEDEDCKVAGGQKSIPNGYSEGPLGHTFVNSSAMDFDPCLTDGIEMAVVSSGPSLCRSNPVGSVWDSHGDCYVTDSSLSSLPDEILEAVSQTGEECRSPWTPGLEAATVELLGDAEPWNLDAISSPLESQEDRILSGPGTAPSYLSSIPMELVDPQLRDTLDSSTSKSLSMDPSTASSTPLLVNSRSSTPLTEWAGDSESETHMPILPSDMFENIDPNLLSQSATPLLGEDAIVTSPRQSFATGQRKASSHGTCTMVSGLDVIRKEPAYSPTGLSMC
jgi:hypothetical protein